jgi:four helix bundle protein
MDERPHRKLEAWKKSMDLVVSVYHATAGFPREEQYGLVSQMRRAAVSIPSNIAEGAGRGSVASFKNSLQIARGSLSELDTQVEVASRLGYLDQAASGQLSGAIEEVSRILNGLIRSARMKAAATMLIMVVFTAGGLFFIASSLHHFITL